MEIFECMGLIRTVNRTPAYIGHTCPASRSRPSPPTPCQARETEWRDEEEDEDYEIQNFHTKLQCLSRYRALGTKMTTTKKQFTSRFSKTD